MQQDENNSILSSYYGDEEVTVIITLKVETRDADQVCQSISLLDPVVDVFLVTGDTDIVVKAKLQNYIHLKKFLVEDLSHIKGLRDTKTLMAVATFKENGEPKYVAD
ncbi:MAG TPA: Lrp/AsnC ligand binding domain-containing protein [Methanomassiliicoccales archaeon]|nr:Lrp/AsnC ligand binding domain-containing protein [Methanomassiliicoccales archaeon]